MTDQGENASSKPYDRRRLMWIHASVLVGCLFPLLGPAIGPWLMWLVFRRDHPLADWHGRKALNFQLTVTLIVTVLLIFMAVLAGAFILQTYHDVNPPGTGPWTDLLARIYLSTPEFVDRLNLGPSTADPRATWVIYLGGISVAVVLGMFLWFMSMILGLVNAVRSHTDDRLIYPWAIPFFKTAPLANTLNGTGGKN